MPTPVWTVVVIDNRSGSNTEVDVTAYTDLSKSTFQPTAQGTPRGSRLYLSFDSTLNVNLNEGYEYWAGYRDPSTLEWDASRAVYGGYVRSKVGGANGTLHTLACDLIEYDWDLATTVIDYWPTHSDLAARVPFGKTMSDWLIGNPISGTAYTGFVRAFLSGIDYSGIESALGAMTFNSDACPGRATNDAPQRGIYGYVTLRHALDDVITTLSFKDNSVDPVAYLEPVVDSTDTTKIRPKLRLVDLALTTGTVDAVYSTTPGVGEYAIEQPFAHVRDVAQVIDRPYVKGQGYDPPTTVTGTYATQVVAQRYRSTRPSNRTRYQTNPGRARVFLNEELSTIALCQTEADKIEERAWGPTGRLSFVGSFYVQPGGIIELSIPEEGQTGTKYRVLEAEAQPLPGRPKWRFTIGDEEPDMANLFPRSSHKAARLAQNRANATAAGLPGSPQATGHSNAPVHSAQNAGRAAGDGVTYRTTRPAMIATGDTRTVGTVREQHKDTADVNRDWIDDGTGTGHPHHLGAYFSALGTKLIPVPDDAITLVRTEVTDQTGADVSATVTVALKLNNVAVVNNPSVAHPLACIRRDSLRITITGTLPTGGCTVLLSEAE